MRIKLLRNLFSYFLFQFSIGYEAAMDALECWQELRAIRRETEERRREALR